MRSLIERAETINELLARYGVKFGIYKNNTFHEQLFPFDAIPRIIDHDEFEYIEKGLIQRVTALNCFFKGHLFRQKDYRGRSYTARVCIFIIGLPCRM